MSGIEAETNPQEVPSVVPSATDTNASNDKVPVSSGLSAAAATQKLTELLSARELDDSKDIFIAPKPGSVYVLQGTGDRKRCEELTEKVRAYCDRSAVLAVVRPAIRVTRVRPTVRPTVQSAGSIAGLITGVTARVSGSLRARCQPTH